MWPFNSRNVLVSVRDAATEEHLGWHRAKVRNIGGIDCVQNFNGFWQPLDELVYKEDGK